MTRFRRTAGAALIAAIFATVALARNALIKGEVRKIDASAGKVTLKHGPVPSLGMDEGMTMVYRVKDPAMLKQLKVGEKVEFEATSSNGAYTVTKIEKGK